MQGLDSKKYLYTAKKRFDPIALCISIAGLVAVAGVAAGNDSMNSLWDTRSIIIVVGGTIASLLFQFDFVSFASALWFALKSFAGTSERSIIAVSKELDQAIIHNQHLTELREGLDINGELLNDVVFMARQGLLFEEIDEFVTSRVRDEFFARKQAVQLFDRAALISPAVGLFGTVIGLIGVLKNLSTPAQIGPSMSLALITTAYGAAMASLVSTPLSGRLGHHNAVFLEIHRQILGTIGILLKRQERDYETNKLGTEVVGY